MTAGAALRPLVAARTLTGAIIFALACFSMIFVTSIDQYLIAVLSRNQYLLHFDSRLCSIRAFDEKVYPHYGGADIHRFAGAGNQPLAGAGLMNFLHWVSVCDHRRHEACWPGRY